MLPDSRSDLRTLQAGCQCFRADLICFESVLVEIKAVQAIAPEHKAQLLNYLKATGIRVGLLVNFAAYPKAIVQRFVR